MNAGLIIRPAVRDWNAVLDSNGFATLTTSLRLAAIMRWRALLARVLFRLRALHLPAGLHSSRHG